MIKKKKQRGKLAIFGVTRNTQRSSLSVNIINHDLSVRCSCYDLFTICGEPDTPDLQTNEKSEKRTFQELAQTYPRPVVISPFPRVGKIKLDMLLIEFICIKHMDVWSDRGINHPTES